MEDMAPNPDPAMRMMSDVTSSPVRIDAVKYLESPREIRTNSVWGIKGSENRKKNWSHTPQHPLNPRHPPATQLSFLAWPCSNRVPDPVSCPVL